MVVRSERVKKLGREMVVLLAALVSAPGFVGAAADINDPRSDLVIPRVERPPTLEDFLGMKANGEMEGQLAKVEGLIQKEPSDGAPSSQEADVYLGYDDKHLYIIFVAFDSEPDKVRARMVPREDIGGDDFVQVLLDTFNDQRRAYSFMANPLGIQRDALFTEGSRRRGGGGGGCEGSFDFSFDTLWHSKGQRTDQGYVIWMSIPFKSLRFPSSPQQTWGILLYRNIPRVNEESFWPHCSSRIQGRLNQAASMRGLENISPGRNVQLIPYGSFRSFRSVDTRNEAQPQFARDSADPDAGLDAKFVLNDSLVVDVAVNPDFSQVESDEPQVTVNRRFEVFFLEKRPFFLENASFFQTPINLLFTRRIADPRVGVRLTGKVGPYAVGAFVIDDESPGKSVLAGDPLAGKRAWFSTVRVNRDLGAQSTLGFIYTDREFEDSYSRVGGVDGRFKLTDNWALTFQGVTSATFDAEEDERLAGPAYNVELSRSGRQLFYKVEYSDVSPGFRTDSGFVRRSDIRQFQHFVDYQFRPEGKYLISWGPEFNTEAVFDHTGTRLDLTQDTEMRWEFVGRTNLGLFYNWDRERLRPEDFEELPENRDFSRNRKGFFFSTSYFSQVTGRVNYAWGTRINFSPPEGQAPVLATLTSADAEVTVRPTTPLRIDNTYILSRLRERGNGASIFNNHILRSKWNYQFNRELSLRVILQYNSVLANPEFSSFQTTKNFNADFLITYLLNPGTALFIGYNGNAQNLSPDLFLCEGPGIERAGCPDLGADSTALLRPRNRYINDAKQFFVKFSYLYRF
jgi:hypothetical protein